MQRAVSFFVLLATLCGPVVAHGGQYRGTTCMGAPTLPPKQSSSSNSPVNFPAAGAVVPGPSSTGSGTSSAGAGVAAGPASPGRTVAPGGGATRGAPIGDDLTRWQYWWEWNKDPYLRLKEALRASSQVRGSDEDVMRGSRSRAEDTMPPGSREIVERVVPALRHALQQGSQRDIVSGSMIALAKVGRSHPTVQILPSFAPHLQSHDQEIRETAALAMGLSRRPAAAPDLIALVGDDAKGRELCGRSRVDERTRSFAAYGLGLLGRTAGVGVQRTILLPLLDVVRDAESGRDLRVAAVNALRLLGPAAAGDRAEGMLREEAVRVLWEYYRGESRPGQQVVRAHALPAIATLRGATTTQSDKDEIARELLDARHRDAAVTQAAAMSLGLACSPAEESPEDRRYSEILRKAYRETLDHQTKYFCLMAVGEIGGEENCAWLLGELRRGSKALVKPWAATALGRLAFALRQSGGAEEACREIGEELLREFRVVRNVETQSAIAVALGLAGHAAAADDLIAVLRDVMHRDELAGYLCVALALMDARHAVDDIRQVVKASVRRPGLLRQSAIALGKLGDKEASEELIRLLVEGSPSLAKFSAVSIALGLIGDRRSIEPLTKLLADESSSDLARAFAAVALGGVADIEALPWGADLAIGVNYRAAVGTLTDGIAGVLDIL